MNKRICVLTIILLLFTGLVIVSIEKTDQPVHMKANQPVFEKAIQPASDISIDDVRQAHNISQQSEAPSVFIIEAVKLTSIYSNFGSGLPNFFERKMSISTDGNAFKLDKIDPLGLREEIELFDGREVHSRVIEMGKLVEAVNHAGASQYGTVEFGIKNCGLLAVLKHLSDPTAAMVYQGRTARKEDKFEVKVATGSFILYADQEHIIHKVEVGKNTIEYADYRSVDGVLLPFIERVFAKGQLKYELIFTRVDLQPLFPAGYFSRKAISKNISH